uniref:HECT-type E3 ubiquitin transferase n=1 Tax=Aureoumbra lagunensis TaxID=44058 RepID=A0A7S3JWL0_9STRA|mmetsp:Transcript_20356/g.26387  ORF Transcript_20356/g.26387 Transcript_20356/m.26387 type:complete len:796 (-) Transcript_20356:389-2776(-)
MGNDASNLRREGNNTSPTNASNTNQRNSQVGNTSANTSTGGGSTSTSTPTQRHSGGGRLGSSSAAPPGAYSVPGSQRRPAQFYVTVPAGIRTGQEFPVIANGQQLMVRCPPGIRAGERIVVSAPRQQQAYMATVPHGVRSGEQFPVLVNNQQLMVTCPPGVRPGMQVRIMVPTQRNNSSSSGTNNQQQNTQRRGSTNTLSPPGGMDDANRSPFGNQMFEVNVPQGVRPGQAFALIANGQRVMVTCPPNARQGMKIRFQLPIKLSSDEIQSIKLNYQKDGWVRTLSTDLTFHWVRSESIAKEEATAIASNNNTVDSPSATSKNDQNNSEPSSPQALLESNQGWTFEKIAFVRELKIDPNKKDDQNAIKKNEHMIIDLVRAEDAALSTVVPAINNGTSLAQELSRYAAMPFHQKEAWFRQQIAKVQVPWEEGHIKINIRRENLLEDSMEAVESIAQNEMKKIFRFEFIGEPGVDAGGVAREWFQLVSDILFNPDFALWSYSSINQMNMQVNPSSGIANDEHLRYFHFTGRLLGKALFDRQIVSGHLVRPLYKHILGWPLMIDDLEQLDHDTHANLLKLKDLEDVELLCLDFTVTEDHWGTANTIELKPDGANCPVTNSNVDEYIQLQMRYRLLDRIKQQVKALLTGFYDVVPEALLSVFDFQELELLLCGLPEIDMDDWKNNTEYTGDYERKGASHKVTKWFWEIVTDDFDEEHKARLLQFVTGTSGVPAQGFRALQGNDNNIRKFTVNSIPESVSVFPKAHTCFNRIDLPLYDTKKKMKKFLTMAIQMEATGFDID